MGLLVRHHTTLSRITIRVYNDQSLQTGIEILEHQLRSGAMEWLCFRLDMFSAVTFALCLIFSISGPKGFIHPGKLVNLLFKFHATIDEIRHNFTS